MFPIIWLHLPLMQIHPWDFFTPFWAPKTDQHMLHQHFPCTLASDWIQSMGITCRRQETEWEEWGWYIYPSGSLPVVSVWISIFGDQKSLSFCQVPLREMLLILWVPPLASSGCCHSLLISADFYKLFLCLTHLFWNRWPIQACHLFLIEVMTEHTLGPQILPLFASEPTVW